MVGAVVTILIVAAVATLGYYQFEVAPGQNTSSSTSSTATAVDCTTTPSLCRNVTIINGASGCAAPACTQGSNAPYGYDPLSITVVVGVNNTILFVNKDSAFHTATEVSGPPNTSFDTKCLDGVGAPCPSGLGSGVSSAQITLTVPGTYIYHCSYHPWMIGKITVVQGTGTTTTSTATSSSSSPTPSSTTST